MTDREARVAESIEKLVDSLRVLQVTTSLVTPIDGVVDELLKYLEAVLAILHE